VIAAEGLDPKTCSHRRDLRACVAKYHCAPLPDQVGAAIGPLLDEAYELGLRVTDARYDEQADGNFYVDLSFSDSFVRLVRDRSQYLLTGPDDQLRALGLFRVLEKAEIVPALQKFIVALQAKR
jgi:hypothetical protein